MANNCDDNEVPAHHNIFLLLALTILLYLATAIAFVNEKLSTWYYTLDSRSIPVLAIGQFFVSYCWAYVLLFVNDIFYILFPKRICSLIKNLIFGVTFIILIIDLFLLYYFDSLLDLGKISIIIGTISEPVTIYEFFLEYVFCPQIFIIALILVTILYTFFKLYNKLKLLLIQGSLLIRLTTYLFCISIVIAFDTSIKTNTFQGFFSRSVYLASSINRIIYDSFNAYNLLGNEEQVFSSYDNNPESIIENSSDIPYIIFILGESADRNKMSCYGYKLENTPFLNKRLDNGEAFAFTDTIAPANYTTLAMQYIFTFNNKESYDLWYNYPNIVDTLIKGGYTVVWISNQTPLNQWGSMDAILAKRSSHFEFTALSTDSFGAYGRVFDEAMLPLLDKYLNKKLAKKQFFVIHLNGSHLVYNRRYPAKFERFTSDDIDDSNIKWATVKAEYANTILYTDYIMEEIIKRLEEKDCLVIYVSDHGEEVFDGRDFCGHSNEEMQNRHMIEIPFVVWGSKTFWQKRYHLREKIITAIDKPYMTDDLIHFILDTIGLKTTSFDPTRSIINGEFNEHRVRMYGGKPYKKGTD